ncbi:MAG: DUF4175 family protein [Chitinophagales bacterium]
MSKISANYQLLIAKLDEFIRKYYVNRLIKGTLYSIGLILIAVLAMTLLESRFYFPTTVRGGFFFGFIALSAFVLINWIIIPLMQFFRLGKVISHEQAANIIGTHFTDVKDKLINILQLRHQANQLSDASLIEASIDQKIEDIRPVPFAGAVDLSKNKQYVKYALVPFLIFMVLLFGAPNLLTTSANRIIDYKTHYDPAAPFYFEVVTDNLQTVQHEDFTVEVKVVKGSALPNEVFIHYNNFPYKLKKKSPTEFYYKFNKLQKDVDFFLEAAGFASQEYSIKVIPKPTMLSFDAVLDYPAYTGKEDEVLRNSGDMVIPMGTKVTWRFEAESTDKVEMAFGKSGERIEATRKGESLFSYNKGFRSNSGYSVFLSNEQLPNADSISYNVSVIPDVHPTISAEQMQDSTNDKHLYFLGESTDDYGIKSINFKYKIESKDKKGKLIAGSSDYQSFPMSVGENKRATTFNHFWDLESMGLKPGDKLTYYFEVWDNDAVNGSKSAQTSMRIFEMPTIKELDEIADKKNDEMKDDLKDVMKDAQELKKDAKEMQEKLVQKKELSWEDKENIEEMLEKHKNLEEKIQKTQKNFNENLEQQKEFKQFNENIQEKQEKLQELFEEVMTDELKELMEKLESLLEELNKEELMEELEDMEMTDEQLENELDRLMELFKQLEFEQKMNETIEKLQELGEEQEQEGEETEDKKEGESLEEQKQDQEELNEKFEDIKKDMEELQKMNEELEKPSEDLQEQTKEEQEDISQEQQESGEKMEQGEQKDAGEKQKNAGKKMQEMAQKMQMMQMEMQMKQAGEDMQAIRQLLENLIDLSHDQENLMDDIASSTINTPQYVSLLQNQYKLKDDAEIIQDSLVALSKRVFQLEAFITKELADINRNLNDAIDELEDRKVPRANAHQQYVMTSTNNLALMLSETMEQMQQQMAQQMQGNQSCQKPGQKPGMKGMSDMQKQLNDRIKKAEDAMKQGKMSGKQMSKEMAQMAAKQAALRQAMQEMAKEQKNDAGKNGDGLGKKLEELAREMEETETDLVNKRLTSEMIKRQNDIMTRLLEAEDAMRQRELDKKRESKTAQTKARNVPPAIEEYLKQRQSEVELYKTVPPSLKPYYKSLVEKYFNAISF